MSEIVSIRIKQIISHYGLNKNSFSVKIGIQPQTLHNIVDGRQTNPSFEVLQSIISSFVDINERWLITGEGPMLKEQDIPVLELSASEVSITANDVERAVLKERISNLEYTIKELKATNEQLLNKVIASGAQVLSLTQRVNELTAQVETAHQQYEHAHSAP